MTSPSFYSSHFIPFPFFPQCTLHLSPPPPPPSSFSSRLWSLTPPPCIPFPSSSLFIKVPLHSFKPAPVPPSLPVTHHFFFRFHSISHSGPFLAQKKRYFCSFFRVPKKKRKAALLVATRAAGATNLTQSPVVLMNPIFCLTGSQHAPTSICSENRPDVTAN